MLLDSGELQICTLINTAPKGAKPLEKLSPGESRFYGERAVGYNRQYAAKGVEEQVDALVRIWQDRSIRIGMYVLYVETGEQYRIDNVQHLTDKDGLPVTDLTLSRLGDLYDIHR